jgi:hypothetical protein
VAQAPVLQRKKEKENAHSIASYSIFIFRLQMCQVHQKF